MAPGDRRVARVEATSRFSKVSIRVVPSKVGAEKTIDAKMPRLARIELKSMFSGSQQPSVNYESSVTREGGYRKRMA